MRHSQVTIPWKEGLHARPAAKLAKSALSFRSSVLLKVNERLADARSILAIMLLAASFGTVVDIEVSGVDEEAALQAITSVFEPAAPEVNDEEYKQKS